VCVRSRGFYLANFETAKEVVQGGPTLGNSGLKKNKVRESGEPEKLKGDGSGQSKRKKGKETVKTN